MKKSNLILIAILLLSSPLIIYGASQYIPAYDGYIVTSGSMEPEIKTGSLLFSYRTSAENIEVGDTITYEDGDHFTTHKVIERINGTSTAFRTQGVANNAPDPGEVTAEMIKGKKLFSIPLMGYVAAWIGSSNGFLALVVVPGILLVLIEVKNIVKEIRGQEEIKQEKIEDFA